MYKTYVSFCIMYNLYALLIYRFPNIALQATSTSSQIFTYNKKWLLLKVWQNNTSLSEELLRDSSLDVKKYGMEKK